MKITINYNYIKKHKIKSSRYFKVDSNEEKLPRDYEVYSIVTVKKKDYYLIVYNKNLVYIPEFLIKIVDYNVGKDWVYKKFNKSMILKDKNIILKITKYLGPLMFLKDETLILDVVNGIVTFNEFNFFYISNVFYQTKNKYTIFTKDRNINLIKCSSNEEVVLGISKFKICPLKKEIYIYSDGKYYIVNYETDLILCEKEIKKLSVEHKFVFQNDGDFIKLENQVN